MSNQPAPSARAPAPARVAVAAIRADDRLAVLNATRGVPLAQGVVLALTAWRRLRGLIGRRPLAPGEGLLLRPCAAVHGAWMRVAIDVIFLDAAGRVVGLVTPLRPWSQSGYCRGACAALELPAGTVLSGGTVVGDEVVFLRSEC